jgi:hypothetical protein
MCKNGLLWDERHNYSHHQRNNGSNGVTEITENIQNPRCPLTVIRGSNTPCHSDSQSPMYPV